MKTRDCLKKPNLKHISKHFICDYWCLIEKWAYITIAKVYSSFSQFYRMILQEFCGEVWVSVLDGWQIYVVHAMGIIFIFFRSLYYLEISYTVREVLFDYLTFYIIFYKVTYLCGIISIVMSTYISKKVLPIVKINFIV